MSTEASMWQWLRVAGVALPTLHMTRIENLVGVGHSDVELCFDAVQCWLELKISKRPVRPTTNLRFGSPLRDSQMDWIRKRLRAGGKVFLFIQVGAGRDRGLYLIPGSFAPEVHAGVTEAWCIAHNVLDLSTPAGVVLAAVKYKEH